MPPQSARRPQNVRDALGELVALANADLTRLAPHDRQDWLFRLWQVADPMTPKRANIEARIMPAELIRPGTLRMMHDLRQLQRDLRRWFTDLRDSLASARRTSTLGLGANSFVVLGRPQIAIRVDPSGRRVRLVTNGDLRTRVLLRAQSLLVELGPSAIRACLGCPRWILGVGKRRYCTSTCRNAHHWRTLPTAKLEQYRTTQYSKHNWTRGARPRQGPRVKNRRRATREGS